MAQTNHLSEYHRLLQAFPTLSNLRQTLKMSSSRSIKAATYTCVDARDGGNHRFSQAVYHTVDTSHPALTCRYFGFSLVKKGPVARRSLVQGNLRLAERGDADRASLRYDGATQLHLERRHAVG